MPFLPFECALRDLLYNIISILYSNCTAGAESMKKIDLIGQRFGRLTVMAPAESAKNGQARWLCRCDCGNECTVLAQNLRRGHTSSCGCSKKHDLTGQKIGRLTVIARSDKRAQRESRTVPLWECRCDCGEITYKATDTLTNPDTSMCAKCAELNSAQKAIQAAGFVGGTQLSRIRTMNAPSTNSSGVRGVAWDPKAGKWRARLRFKGKHMNFGSYKRFEDAVAARKKAEAEYFGAALAAYEDEQEGKER